MNMQLIETVCNTLLVLIYREQLKTMNSVTN